MTDSAPAWDRIDDVESADTQDILREMRKVTNTCNSIQNKIRFAESSRGLMEYWGEAQLEAHSVRKAQYRAGLVYIAELTRELLAR